MKFPFETAKYLFLMYMIRIYRNYQFKNLSILNSPVLYKKNRCKTHGGGGNVPK